MIKYLFIINILEKSLELQYKSIAVVDDEQDIITLFNAVLHGNGYHMIGFTNPILALNYIHNHPNEFGLIILDYRMSPMQGCELANKISAINPRIKMVLITAYNDIVSNDLNLEIVKKPITNTRLVEIIHHHLN